MLKARLGIGIGTSRWWASIAAAFLAGTVVSSIFGSWPSTIGATLGAAAFARVVVGSRRPQAIAFLLTAAIPFALAAPWGIAWQLDAAFRAETLRRIEALAPLPQGRDLSSFVGGLDALSPSEVPAPRITFFAPWGVDALRYHAEEPRAARVDAYLTAIETILVTPVAEGLRDRLLANDDDLGVTYAYLEHYLALELVEHLRPTQEASFYAGRWAALTRLKDRGAPRIGAHLERYFQALGRGARRAPPSDESAIRIGRERLRRGSAERLYFDRYVDSIGRELHDPGLDAIRSNSVYPDLTLVDLIPGARGEPKTLISEALETRRPLVVPGQYTERGRAAVLANLKSGRERLVRDAWILPLEPRETEAYVTKILDRVRGRYDERLREVWVAFVEDLSAVRPRDAAQAKALFRVTAAKKPLLKVLAAVSAFDDGTDPFGLASTVRLGLETNHPANRYPKDSQPLDRYFEALGRVADALDEDETAADKVHDRLEEARAVAEHVLEGADARARHFLRDILLDPLAYEPFSPPSASHPPPRSSTPPSAPGPGSGGPRPSGP